MSKVFSTVDSDRQEGEEPMRIEFVFCWAEAVDLDQRLPRGDF